MVLGLAEHVFWGWGLGQSNKSGRKVRRGRSVGSAGDGSWKRLGGKVALGVLLKNWG